MAISKYSRVITPAEYTPRSIEDYMQVPKMKTELTLKGQESLGDMLFDKTLTPMDQAKLADVIGPFNENIDALSEKLSKGDLSPQVLMDITKLSSDYKRLTSPGGDYGRAAANYEAILKDKQESINKYKVLPEAAESYYDNLLSNWQTYPEQGFGAGQDYAGAFLPQYQNVNEYLTKVIDNIPASVYAEYLDDEGKRMLNEDPKNFNTARLLGHISEQGRAELRNKALNVALQDKDFMSSYNWHAQQLGWGDPYTQEGNQPTINRNSALFKEADAIAFSKQFRKESLQQGAETKPVEPEEVEPYSGLQAGTVIPNYAAADAIQNPTNNENLKRGYENLQFSIDITNQRLADAYELIGNESSAALFAPVGMESSDVINERRNIINGVLDMYNLVQAANGQITPELIQNLASTYASQVAPNEQSRLDIQNNMQQDLANDFQGTLNKLGTAAAAFDNANAAALRKNSFDTQREENYQTLIAQVGGEEKLHSLVGLTPNFLDKAGLTPRISQEFKNGLLQTFKVNLPYFIDHREEDLREILFEDQKSFANNKIEELTENLNQSGLSANLRTEINNDIADYRAYLNKEGNLYELFNNQVTKIVGNWDSQIEQDRDYNPAAAVNPLSLNLAEETDKNIKTKSENLIKSILNIAQEVNILNSSLTLQQIWDKQYEGDNNIIIEEPGSFDLHIAPVNGSLYAQLEYIDPLEGASKEPLFFTLNLENLTELNTSFNNLVNDAFGIKGFGQEIAKDPAGRMSLVYYALKDSPLKADYLLQLFLKPGEESVMDSNQGLITIKHEKQGWSVRGANTPKEYYDNLEDIYLKMLYNFN